MQVTRTHPLDASASRAREDIAERHHIVPGGQIAVIRALNLGDMLCAVPALRALRRAVPDGSITLVGLPWARAFAARFHELIDDFVALPGFPALREQPACPERLPEFLAGIHRRRFDLVLQMHGSGGASNILASLFGARGLAGFYEPGRFCPDPVRFLPYPDSGPEIRRLLALTSFLGIPSQGEQLAWPVVRTDKDELGVMAAVLEARRYVCLHPGGRNASRRADPRLFAQVGDYLSRRGFEVVLTGGADERDLTKLVAGAMRAPVIDHAGRTSLSALGWLLRDAELVVSNDTGVAHLADAVDTRSVVFFDSSQIERWAPLDRARHRVVAPSTRATPEQAISEIANVLERDPRAAASRRSKLACATREHHEMPDHHERTP